MGNNFLLDAYTTFGVQECSQVRHIFTEKKTTGNTTLINPHYVVYQVTQPALVFNTEFGFSIQTPESVYNFSIPTAFHDFIEQYRAINHIKGFREVYET